MLARQTNLMASRKLENKLSRHKLLTPWEIVSSVLNTLTQLPLKCKGRYALESTWSPMNGSRIVDAPST
ncbi:hypothetical protein Tco_0772992 [Tanacetum coccineum]|uniref:Uncharacterized protein n=1 Tax=Tanacetum coccineum TaxID=301880 RepID=A0ABQ4ZLN1_9ASTR